MPEIIFGILLLALGLWAINAFTSIDPRKLAPIIKFAGGFGALGGAAFLAARGQIGVVAQKSVWSQNRLAGEDHDG
jgi:hypothetical protein